MNTARKNPSASVMATSLYVALQSLPPLVAAVVVGALAGLQAGAVGLLVVVVPCLLVWLAAPDVSASWVEAVRIGADAWAQRSRRRRKEKLTLIRGDEEDDEFVKSVERDLADLPVWDEHEDRPRR